MTRQQRRAELRAIDKEVKSIWKNRDLIRIVKSNAFEGMKSEDFDLLEAQTYPDKELQTEYTFFKEAMLRLRYLDARKAELGNNKEAVPNVQ